METILGLLFVSMCLLPQGVIPTKNVRRMALASKDAKEMSDNNEALCQPEQVHISYGNTISEMVVMWATRGPCDTVIHYAPRPWDINLVVAGSVVELDQTLNKTLRYVHRTVLKNLLPSTTYYFRPNVKDSFGADLFYFMTPISSNESWSSNFLVLGNIDTEDNMMDMLSAEAHLGKYSAILSSGDLEDRLVFEDEWEDGGFLSELEQATGFVPFMTAPGRKVSTPGGKDGLYYYRHTFSMPGTDWPIPINKLWYSFDVGLIHFVSYSTDVLFETDTTNAKAQKDWLVQDLKEANTRRPNTPWIIVFGGQPMYCSSDVLGTEDCAQNTSRVRHGLEDIFYFYGVDLVIEFHHTTYERSWPQYKGVVITKSYQNPKAPIEIIIGSDSSKKGSQKPKDVNSTATTADWSAFQLPSSIATSSLGRLSVVNCSHLRWELISVMNQSVVDTFWIIQNSHGNFSLASLPHNISHQINQTIIAMGGKPGTYDFISGSTGSANDSEGWSEYSLWLGLAIVGAILFIIIGMVGIRSCVRRRRLARAGRRWRDVDRDGSAGGNFYSVASDSDTEDNDFEIDVYEKANKQSSKLLTSY